MKLVDIVRNSRSYRRFDQSIPMTEETLLDLIDTARITPSAKNAQPLRYIFSCEPGMNDRIFETLAWAGSLTDWKGPKPGEQPTGYVVILLDQTISKNADRDVGIVGQTMLLRAAEQGLGGCMVGSVRRKVLAAILEIEDQHDIVIVIALGTPVEQVVLEDVDSDASVDYYREADGTHHVPKRKLADLVLKSFT